MGEEMTLAVLLAWIILIVVLFLIALIKFSIIGIILYFFIKFIYRWATKIKPKFWENKNIIEHKEEEESIKNGD